MLRAPSHTLHSPSQLSLLQLVPNLQRFHRPNCTKKIPIRTLDLMYFNFVPAYQISSNSYRMLSDRKSIHCGPLASRLLDRPREGLWVYWATNLETKPVLRHCCLRRMRSALIEELQKRGFDKDGKRAVNGKGRGAGKKNGLYGTLNIGAHQGLPVAKGQELRRQMGLIVERLEEMCENWRVIRAQ